MVSVQQVPRMSLGWALKTVPWSLAARPCPLLVSLLVKGLWLTLLENFDRHLRETSSPLRIPIAKSKNLTG